MPAQVKETKAIYRRAGAPPHASSALFGLQSRRDFLSTAASVVLISRIPVATIGEERPIKISSPNKSITFQLLRDPKQLTYQVTLKRQPVLGNSRLGIVVDGVELTQGVKIKQVDTYRVREKYPVLGVHSEAVNHANGARISATHLASNTDFTVDIRVFDDGVAFRIIVPGEGNRVPDEATSFSLPAGSVVWFHDFEGHYEGVHVKKQIASVKEGEWAAPPVTFKLPNGSGYAAITEAALINFAGMGLQANGENGFAARLGHALPVSYPFRLRYGTQEGERLKQPASVSGTIKTPWRVIIVGSDLDTLVNSDIVQNVSPSPDARLFPAGPLTDWIKPGRAVWKFLDGGENTLASMKEFSRLAGQLGFEYNIVEGFWQRWTEADMRELTDYSRQFNVGVWFWKHRRDLGTAQAREKFFELCRRVGVVGAKIDFLDHEAKEVIDLYQALLKDAAEHKIMVDFHGANKPAGEARTWPNEMTREGIYGMEHRSMPAWSTHNTTLPFTRFLAGHADFTPVHFGERRKETSWAHQIATAAAFNSPVLIFAAHPKALLENPAVEMIKSIPSVWDETRVLPPSEIGELAMFARRKGSHWFLVILNGPTERRIKVPLSFLNRGRYTALTVADDLENAAAVKLQRSDVGKGDFLDLELRAGGGFIGRFTG
jgi:alpha-glucosidase